MHFPKRQSARTHFVSYFSILRINIFELQSKRFLSTRDWQRAFCPTVFSKQKTIF